MAVGESNATPLTEDFADPVSIGEGTISLGDTVSYTDLDGATGEGVVVSIVPDDPTREGGVSGWLLEVMPTGGTASVMVMPGEASVVVAAGSAEAAVVSDNMDAQDSSTEASMPAIPENGLAELERAAALADKVKEALGLLATMGGEVFADGNPEPVVEVEGSEVEVAATTDEFTAIMSHSTGFSDDPWDGTAEEARVTSPNDEQYFANVYAWRDDEADTSVKAAYRFIHHFVGADGTPGAASTTACSTGIGVLNGARGGTTIPEADRQGVYDHMARHLREADREPPMLLSAEAYEAALADANATLAAELADEASPLVGLSDDDLITELARRWASDLVGRLGGDEAAAAEDTGEFGGDVEIEIEIGEGDEKGGYPEGMECCPMCEGACEVVINGITAMCPMCEGSGYVPMSEEAEMEPPDISMMELPLFTEGDEVTAADEGTPVPTTATYDWEGVLIVEGIPSGDGRMIAEQALTWRELPIPLMLQTVNAPGHEGAVIAGSIHEIVREGQNVVGRGYFDSGDAGLEAKRLLSEGTMRGVSADIDSVMVEFVTPEGAEVTMEDMLFAGVDALEVLVEGRIMGATLTPFPAFQEAFVQVINGDAVADDMVLVASGAEIAGDVWRVPSPLGAWLPGEENAEEALASLVASAAASVDVPANPPREWFLPGDMDKPEPFTVHADGRVYGLVARWGTCHIGFTDRCVNVPKSGSAYKHFRNKNVLTAEGDLVATGPVFMDTVHPDLRLRASDTQAFYADTGCAVADVALYENEHGIVAAGALRPGLSPEQVRRFRGSDVSPDWRQINGRLEVVGLLSVNVSGFIVEGLVASGAEVSNPRGLWNSAEGELTTLVAAGMVRHADTEMSDLRAEVAALRAEMDDFREAVRPIRAQRASERFALLAQAFGEKHPETVDDHGCGGACGGSDGACACG